MLHPDSVDPAQIEATLMAAVATMERPAYAGRGRPQVLSPAVLWASLVLALLEHEPYQSAVWRRVRDTHLWRAMAADVTDEAVYRRLATADPDVFATLFTQLTGFLRAQIEPWAETTLAPFATMVVALDNTRLDKAVRTTRMEPPVPVRLPGQLATLFNLRTHLWEQVLPIMNPDQNEKLTARSLVAGLPTGSLILADRGFFSFSWFDDLTDAGQFWISRLPAKVSMRVVHPLLHRDTQREDLVYLGAHRSDRSKHLVRFVTVTNGANTWQCVTNVLDPAVLSVQDMAALYARRWDIEIAFRTLKVDLNLRGIWSTKWPVVQQQVWAVLLIAQIVFSLRTTIAGHAGVPVDDVSVRLLIREFPKYAARSADPVATYIAVAHQLRYIRPSRRIVITLPAVPLAAYAYPPPTLERTQKPRYAPHAASRRSPRDMI